MKNYTKYFLLGSVILVSSPPLGYFILNVVFFYKDLTGMFDILLNGFIHSIMMIGVLVFGIGLVEMFIEKRS